MTKSRAPEPRIIELEKRLSEARAGGGEARVERQHAAGKLTAHERLELLLDPGSFVEIDALVTHRCQDFGIGDLGAPQFEIFRFSFRNWFALG